MGKEARFEVPSQVADALKRKDKIIENLQGHIRRLEKSNQQLGEELHRCCDGEGTGWNKNVVHYQKDPGDETSV